MNDWIKVRVTLFTHPKILRMADLLAASQASLQPLLPGLSDAQVTPGDVHRLISRRMMRDACVAAVLRVWGAANLHTSRGEWKGVTLEMVDDLAEIPGFGRIMEAVGWVKYDAAKRLLKLPNFLKFNVPAKARAIDTDHPEAPPRTAGAIRQARLRQKRRDAERNAGSDAPCNGTVTPDVTHRSEADQIVLSHTGNGRVTGKVLLTERPGGWPVTEAQARSMAVAAGVEPDMAATYWHHHEGLSQWPPGNFANFIASKRGFKLQDAADRDREIRLRETLRAQPVTPGSRRVTSTEKKDGF